MWIHMDHNILLLLYKPITVMCDEKMETRTVPPPPTAAFSVVAVMSYNITHRYNICTCTPILYNIYIFNACACIYVWSNFCANAISHIINILYYNHRDINIIILWSMRYILNMVLFFIDFERTCCRIYNVCSYLYVLGCVRCIILC